MDGLLECGPLAAMGEDGRTLFDGTEVRLREGGLTMLEGASGTGKTSLLRLMVGLDPCPGVKRRLLGEAFPTSRLPAWRARVTLCPQDAPLLPGSVRVNLEFPFRQRHGAGRSFELARARALLDKVGLGGLGLDREISRLSGGERHRVALVRALLWDPVVLIADEPLSGLDSETAERCFGLIKGHGRRPGHAALVVLHDRELGDGGDHTWVLRNGRLEVA